MSIGSKIRYAVKDRFRQPTSEELEQRKKDEELQRKYAREEREAAHKGRLRYIKSSEAKGGAAKKQSWVGETGNRMMNILGSSGSGNAGGIAGGGMDMKAVDSILGHSSKGGGKGSGDNFSKGAAAVLGEKTPTSKKKKKKRHPKSIVIGGKRYYR